MVLADSKILEKIGCGDIIINPFEISQLNPNSYDLRLGDKLMVYKEHVLDPKKELEVDFIDIPEDGILLMPNKLYLGSTREILSIKKDIGVFSGISSMARLGVTVHITACYINTGWCGGITLEIMVAQPTYLYNGMLIGQIYFQSVDGFFINGINQNYSNEESLPVKSMMFKKFEQDGLRSFKNRIKDSGISFDPENIQE